MAIFLNVETTTLQKIFCFIIYSIYIYQIELKEKCGEGLCLYAFGVLFKLLELLL